MLKESKTEMEEKVLQYKSFDQNTILHEYEDIVTSLKVDLNNCQLEQSKLRTEIETLRKENENANDIFRQSLSDNHNEKYSNIPHNQEVLTNLEKRITILQMEKDSVFQLWQMALKAIDVLEEELKTVHKGDKSTKFYQEQVNNIKETYSEAIKVLESKLIASKENFFQQQVLSEKSKEKIDQLSKEKSDIIQQLSNLQHQAFEKEKDYQKSIDSLKENLSHTKGELEQLKQNKFDLEEKLKNSEKFANTMLSKDFEAKSKVTEAVNLIECTVKERNEILRREACLIAEKTKLESRLAKLSEESASHFQKQILKAKETYSKNIKKYLVEIKELKAELREQSTLLNRSQREYRLIEEELEKVCPGSGSFVQRSNTRITNLEKILQEKELKSQTNGEHKIVYDDKIHYLERQISHLQDKLYNTSEKLRRIHLQSSRDVEDHAREADGRTREILEKCSNFERQLSRALNDKETLASHLHSLEISFEKEIQKRNHEKILLENKVRDLQEKIMNDQSIIDASRIFIDKEPNRRNIGQQTSMNFESITNILMLQEKYDKKTKELTQHVETHQQLSNKWKEEVNLLTIKFQKRTQELRNKINALQKQNEDLSKELLFYQQLLARCNTQLVQNYVKDTETR